MLRLNESRTSALLTEAFGATFLANAATTPHTEHACTLLVGLDADVRCGGLRGRAILVPPDTTYAASCPGALVTYTFDPELCAGIAGFARSHGTRGLDGALGSIIVDTVRAHAAELTAAEALREVGRELSMRLALGAAARVDRRIARLLDELRDPLVDRRVALARTKLSAAHVQDLFARDVGMPIRTYSLWRRLLHGLARVGPLDLTAAAHAAGFADLAHFSRTCRRMLGYAPSELQRHLITR
jgi:AraC-like DNA-binding protein